MGGHSHPTRTPVCGVPAPRGVTVNELKPCCGRPERWRFGASVLVSGMRFLEMANLCAKKAFLVTQKANSTLTSTDCIVDNTRSLKI